MIEQKLLLVDDQPANLVSLEAILEEEGRTLLKAESGQDALKILLKEDIALVLLDVQMPGMDGLEVCRRLRAQHPLLYILMLTARADEVDRIVGLEVGADDYVTKPFSLQELVARVRAVLRRLRTVEERLGAPSEDSEGPLTFDGLVVDPVRRTVEVDGEKVHLTVREFDLLAYLAQHPDRPFTRMQLLENIWGETYEGYDRTIDSHVQRLRAKIEPDAGNPRWVRTVWGVGYKLASEDE